MNSQRTKQHICKPHKLTHDQGLQKSCFLADTPTDLSIFVFFNQRTENIEWQKRTGTINR